MTDSAPVVLSESLEGEEVAYPQAMVDLPALQSWTEAARQEPWTIAAYE